MAETVVIDFEEVQPLKRKRKRGSQETRGCNSEGYFSAAALDLRPTSSGFKAQYRWFTPCQGELLQTPIEAALQRAEPN